MAHTITLIPGDGIGPEVTDAVVRILDGSRRLDRLGAPRRRRGRVERTGKTLPRELLESIKRNKVALKGPVTTPVGKGSRASTSACARRSTSTRTCARSRTSPGVASRFEDVDLVIVRENTEDLYAGLEHESCPASSRA